jgi:hypothetical protein
MKVKLSKSQWEEAGKKAGWMGKYQDVDKNVDIFEFMQDWGEGGYGIALISADDIILDPYIDPSDYPDMILSKSGNFATVVGGKNKGCKIIFHSGQFEGNVGKDWYDSTMRSEKHLGEDKPTMED